MVLALNWLRNGMEGFDLLFVLRTTEEALDGLGDGSTRLKTRNN